MMKPLSADQTEWSQNWVQRFLIKRAKFCATSIGVLLF